MFAKEGAIVIGIGFNNCSSLESIKDLPNVNDHPHSIYNCDVSSESSVKSVIENVYKVSMF